MGFGVVSVWVWILCSLYCLVTSFGRYCCCVVLILFSVLRFVCFALLTCLLFTFNSLIVLFTSWCVLGDLDLCWLNVS